MKTKNDLPLKQWLWLIGAYCISSVFAIIIGTVLVNTGKISLDNSRTYFVCSIFISGMIIGLLSRKLPLQWLGVGVGIVILLNTACALLVFTEISNTFILQNGSLLLGSILGYLIITKPAVKSKGKRRRKKYS